MAIIIIIALILSIRVTLNIIYRDSVTIFLKILFIKIQLLPAKEKKFNPKKLNKQQKKKTVRKSGRGVKISVKGFWDFSRRNAVPFPG